MKLQMEIYSGSKTVVRDKVNKFLQGDVNVFSTHVDVEGNEMTVTIFYSKSVNITFGIEPPISKEAMAQAAMPAKANPAEAISKAIKDIKIPEIEIPIREPLIDLGKVAAGDLTLGGRNK